MDKLAKLEFEIGELRSLLQRMAGTHAFTSTEMLAVSHALDGLLNQYDKLQREIRSDRKNDRVQD